MRMRALALAVLAVLVLSGLLRVAAGPPPIMAPPPDAAELSRRRAALARAIGDGVVVVEAHGTEEGSQVDRDFYYLVGVEVGGARLVLGIVDGEATSTLFLPARDPGWELWHGPRLAPGDEARRVTGLAEVLSLAALPGRMEQTLEGRATAWVTPAVAHARGTPGPLHRELRALGPELEIRSYGPALHGLRQRKSAYEIARLREAIAITQSGLESGMLHGVAGAWEFQVQAAIEGAFLERGSPRPGFDSIVGSGPNSCILHYHKGRRRLEKGELLLMDVGATSRGYTADITRTIPVSGKFTARQREIYEWVLRAQEQAIALIRPGVHLRQVHGAAQQVIAEAGFRLPHRTSHHVGLDVHDVGPHGVLAPGMVVTVEPGIYLADEGIGVRIEDMVLVTEDGHELLSAAIPRHPDAIEKLLERLRKKPRTL